MSDFRRRPQEIFESPDRGGFAIAEGNEEGARSGGFVDTDLLIRTAVYLGSGAIRYRDIERKGPQGAAYRAVEGEWKQATRGFINAVRLFKKAGVQHGTWLPYRYLLLPLAIASAKGTKLGDPWLGWAILASLWRHYAGEVDTKLQRDSGLAEKGDVRGLIDHVRSRAKRIESAIPEEDDFTEGIVNQAGVLLGLLIHFARTEVRSFPGEKCLLAADEPLEVHHIFPRAVLDRYSERNNEFVPDRLGNLTLLMRSDNEHLGVTPPSEYLPTIRGNTRNSHLIPPDKGLWGVERYADFCLTRELGLARTLRELLRRLVGEDTQVPNCSGLQ